MFVGTGVEIGACEHLTMRLGYGECLQLLETVRVGRVVFHAGGKSVMQLASHAVIGGDIAVLTLAGGSLSRLVQSAGRAGASLAYEVDGVDAHGLIAWDLIVDGRALASADPEFTEAAWAVLDPLFDRFRGHVIRLVAESTRGFGYQ